MGRSFNLSEHLGLLVTSDKLVNEAQHNKIRKHTQHDIASHGSKLVFEILPCQVLIMRFDLFERIAKRRTGGGLWLHNAPFKKIAGEFSYIHCNSSSQS